MRKFLSLVMALVMMMSLVTITAGAEDFTDADDVSYVEAVEVISAVKVMDGDTDGTFRPQGGLTRQAAAKIICNMILGPTTAAELHADAAPYPDVPVNNHFAGYIAYCAKEGIISGYADGTFKPTNPLTGYAFMKMLLGALGYDAEIEGYIGENWSINVAKQAIGIGLNEGLVDEFNGVDQITREEAALYSFNTLQATMVDYDEKITVQAGDGSSVIIGNSTAAELPQGSIYDNNMRKAGLQFAEKYFDRLIVNRNSVDAFMRPANTWRIRGAVIGTYSQTPDLVYDTAVKGKAIYADLDKSVPAARVFTYEDGVDSMNGIAVVKGNNTDIGWQGSRTEVFYDDDANLAYAVNDKVTIVTINYYFAEILGDYDEVKEQVTFAFVDSAAPAVDKWTISSDDFTGLETLKDEDKVLLTLADTNNDGQYEVQSIELAEMVTAAVTEYDVPKTVNSRDAGYVYAGDAKYAYNYTYADADRTYELKDEYNLYLDPTGNVIWADGVEAEGNYFFVPEYEKDTGLTGGKLEAYAYALDGTKGVVALSKLDGNKPSQIGRGLYTYNKWVSFREKTEGKYEINQKPTEGGVFGADTVDVIENGKGAMIIPGGTVRVTNSTTFLVNDVNDNVKVYKGIKEVPTIDAADGTGEAAGATAIYVMKDGNYARFVFVDVNGGRIKGGDTSDVIFLRSTTPVYAYSQDKDDNTYYTYKAVVNGVEQNVKVEVSVITPYGSGAGYLYSDVFYSTPGYVDGMTQVNASTTAANAIFEDEFAWGDTNNQALKREGDVLSTADNTLAFYLAKGAQAVIIKNNGDIDRTTTAHSLGSTYKTTALDAHIAAVLNKDGEATMLYVYLQ